MTKFVAREPEVVDAYQFAGGEKDGLALVELINQTGAVNSGWVPLSGFGPERIKIVTDSYSEDMHVGSWFIFREDNVVTHMTNDEFIVRFKKAKFRPSVLIWKDIPGFPNWQISDNGRVRNTGYVGYKQRTRNGDFILRRNGKTERWSEAQLGNEEQIKAFFGKE